MMKIDKTVAANFLHKIGFWFTIIFLVGMLVGVTFTKKMVELRLNEAEILGGVVIDGKPFDLKARFN